MNDPRAATPKGRRELEADRRTARDRLYRRELGLDEPERDDEPDVVVIATPTDTRLGATPLGELLAGLDADDLDALAARLARRLSPPEPVGRFTSQEAADYLGISMRTLYRRTGNGEIECERDHDGGRVYFTRATLDAYRGVS